MLRPRNNVNDNSIFFIYLDEPYYKRLQKYNFYCNSPKNSQLNCKFMCSFQKEQPFNHRKIRLHSETKPHAGGYPQTPFLSFSSARRKELKEASTPSKASPYMGRMQLIPGRNRPPSRTSCKVHIACAPSG